MNYICSRQINIYTANDQSSNLKSNKFKKAAFRKHSIISMVLQYHRQIYYTNLFSYIQMSQFSVEAHTNVSDDLNKTWRTV